METKKRYLKSLLRLALLVFAAIAAAIVVVVVLRPLLLIPDEYVPPVVLGLICLFVFFIDYSLQRDMKEAELRREINAELHSSLKGKKAAVHVVDSRKDFYLESIKLVENAKDSVYVTHFNPEPLGGPNSEGADIEYFRTAERAIKDGKRNVRFKMIVSVNNNDVFDWVKTDVVGKLEKCRKFDLFYNPFKLDQLPFLNIIIADKKDIVVSIYHSVGSLEKTLHIVSDHPDFCDFFLNYFNELEQHSKKLMSEGVLNKEVLSEIENKMANKPII